MSDPTTEQYVNPLTHEVSTVKPDVRTWARENGFEVAPVGRLSAEVKRAYAEAHPDA